MKVTCDHLQIGLKIIHCVCESTKQFGDSQAFGSSKQFFFQAPHQDFLSDFVAACPTCRFQRRFHGHCTGIYRIYGGLKTQSERERERERDIYIYIQMHIYIYYIYTYIHVSLRCHVSILIFGMVPSLLVTVNWPINLEHWPCLAGGRITITWPGFQRSFHKWRYPNGWMVYSGNPNLKWMI